MEEKRLISKERGEKVAEENGIKFYETSAKENVNIEHAFITVSTQFYFFFCSYSYNSLFRQKLLPFFTADIKRSFNVCSSENKSFLAKYKIGNKIFFLAGRGYFE